MKAEIQAILCNLSRPAYAAAIPTAQKHEGVRGKRHFSLPPAAFRRFRRAKAAFCSPDVSFGAAAEKQIKGAAFDERKRHPVFAWRDYHFRNQVDM